MKLHTVLGTLALVGCVSDSQQNQDSGSPDATTPPPDVSVPDAPIQPDAGNDAAADTGIPTVYSDMTVASKWEAYGLVANIGAQVKYFAGATFDGKNLYLVPGGGAAYLGVVVKYDVSTPFKNANSWVTFDIAQQVATTLRGFGGGVFDGRYVYLVPAVNSTNGIDGVVGRYDTLGPFANASSWSSFDIATVSPTAKGYAGAAFDGQYIYFCPYFNTTGKAARYDTQSAFTTGTSWTTFDITTVDAAGHGLAFAGFDGRYIYYGPVLGKSPRSGVVVRHDTQMTFDKGWEVFDATTVAATARGFSGMVFDGRYMYFIPDKPDDTTFSGLVLRYDSQGTFTSGSSWSTFDVSGVNANAKGYAGGTFDGRYVYFAPLENAAGASGLVVRYDTTASFGAAASWQIFDVSTIDSNAKRFFGAAFDGKYVYLIPDSDTSTIVRFDAKSPASIPPKPTGSFF